VRYHGVLVDVGGVGVLLAGPSGAGKSECALELITRGHRLVADDAVELTREGERLIGRAAAAIGGHLEIRGLGILSIPDLYGPNACAESAAVDLICRLDPGRADFDRTGLDRESEDLLGVAVPRVVLPASPGTSLATIVDAAARDHRLRRTGPGSAERFDAHWRRARKAAERPRSEAKPSEAWAPAKDRSS
jgi:HPr kinase/phosphorylase